MNSATAEVTRRLTVWRWARSKVGNGAVVGGISRIAGAESVKENTSFTAGSCKLAGGSRKSARTGTSEKLVDSSRAGTTILAGVANTGVAGVGARVVGGNGGPRGVVCHGAEIVSTAEQEEVLKTRGMELGGNGSNELVAVERPEKEKKNHIVTRRQKKRNLRVGYAQHLEGGQKHKFDRNGPGKVVALEEPREEKKKRKEKKRKEKKSCESLFSKRAKGKSSYRYCSEVRSPSSVGIVP